MRKVIFLSLFTFVLLSATAQVQTQVIGDSVFVHGNTSTGELILQNSTDSVNGFLFNNGAGRTQFRRGLIKIDDSTYLIGADTLHIKPTGGSGTGYLKYAGTIPSYFTPTQVTADLNPFTGSIQGMVPSSSGAAANFLNGAGGWTSPVSTNFADTNLTFTGARTHNSNNYHLLIYNTPYIAMISDTFRLKTREDVLNTVNMYKSSDSSLFDGFLVQYSGDLSFGTPYCDCIDGNDAMGGNSLNSYHAATGQKFKVERRFTFDSTILQMASITTGINYYLKISYLGLAPFNGKKPAIAILHDKYLGTYTTLNRDSTKYTFSTTSDTLTYKYRFVINYYYAHTGVTNIIANVDSSGIPANIAYFDHDSLKVAPYPNITSGTLTSITPGYGMINTPNPIVSTGIVTVDSAALHLK